MTLCRIYYYYYSFGEYNYEFIKKTSVFNCVIAGIYLFSFVDYHDVNISLKLKLKVLSMLLIMLITSLNSIILAVRYILLLLNDLAKLYQAWRVVYNLMN